MGNDQTKPDAKKRLGSDRKSSPHKNHSGSPKNPNDSSAVAARDGSVSTTRSRDDEYLTKFFQKTSTNATEKNKLDRSDFVNTLFTSVPAVGGRVFDNVFWAGCDASGRLDLNTYLDRYNKVSLLVTGGQQMAFYFGMFASNADTMTGEDAMRMLLICRQVSYLTIGINVEASTEPPDKFLSAVVKSFVDKDTASVSASGFNSVCSRVCPRLFSDFHSYVLSRLYGDTTGFTLQEDSSALNPLVHLCLADPRQSVVSTSILWLVSGLLPAGYFPETPSSDAMCDSNLIKIGRHDCWNVLYDSNSHGLSMNRFQHHALDYTAPTLLFVSFDHFVYAVAIDSPWKESPQRWGGSECLFLQLLPEFKLCQSGAGLLHFNLTDRNAPKGIQVGKDFRTTFFKIDEDLSKANHYGVDIKLLSVEVWGCGGRSKMEALEKHKQWERREVDKHQNRKLVPEDWKSSGDRTLLELGGVKTDHAERGDI